MGIISLEKINCLFWLGRYSERVFTTLKAFGQYYDKMIDYDADAYKEFCAALNIPDIYLYKEDFIYRYLFEKENPDSICSNMNRAFDNAVILRDEITSETLAYIQMALDVMKVNHQATAPVLALLPVLDYLYAFWGSVEDNVLNDEARYIMKCGRYIERLDLYLRLNFQDREIAKECGRLKNRLQKTKIALDKEAEEKTMELIAEKNYREALDYLNRILPC
ncbi:MAG: alpha-E domain-containing protein [bacterium]